jgi:hypothetical protein
MADDLATDIRDTKKRIERLEQHIANNDFAGTPYDDRTEAKAALTQLNEQLQTLYDTRRAAQTKQQQQIGAGTSMLPVRQELVMFPCQSSCCMHQQTLQHSERVFLACAFDLLQMHRYHTACHRCRCLICFDRV